MPATLSLSTNAFLADYLGECLEWAARLGLGGVEIGPTHARLMAESPSVKTHAMASFQRLNIKPFSVHAWGPVEALEPVCHFARDIAAGLVVVHCRDEAIVESFDTQVVVLREWGRWCGKRGIILTVENSSRQKVEMLARLFRALPELRMTLDVKHAYKPETLGLTHADFMAEFSDRLANFHISGINRAREELGDGCPPGQDAVSWTELASELARLSYRGLITVELNLPDWMSETEREAAYADLPPATPEGPTTAHRLAAHGVNFFREKLAAALV